MAFNDEDVTGGNGNMYDTTMKWRRSSFCADSSCVEVATTGDRVLVRDGKDRDREYYLAFSKEDWAGFVEDIESGRYARL
ncbi:DUF397 domain-containing protein [Actinoplanes missouriensis]|uniref:DUF397 domain-containing protein n=1 Tax=Actinoplanes missouriensis TaxID=1866 RepID=UPI003402A92C